VYSYGSFFFPPVVSVDYGSGRDEEPSGGRNSPPDSDPFASGTNSFSNSNAKSIVF